MKKIKKKTKKKKQKENGDKIETYDDFSRSIKSTPPILLLYKLMPFRQFTGKLDEEPSYLLCTVNTDVISSKRLWSSITDMLSYHLIQATWL